MSQKINLIEKNFQKKEQQRRNPKNETQKNKEIFKKKHEDYFLKDYSDKKEVNKIENNTITQRKRGKKYTRSMKFIGNRATDKYETEPMFSNLKIETLDNIDIVKKEKEKSENQKIETNYSQLNYDEGAEEVFVIYELDKNVEKELEEYMEKIDFIEEEKSLIRSKIQMEFIKNGQKYAKKENDKNEEKKKLNINSKPYIPLSKRKEIEEQIKLGKKILYKTKLMNHENFNTDNYSVGKFFNGVDIEEKNGNVNFRSITILEELKYNSFEELRLEDRDILETKNYKGIYKEDNYMRMIITKIDLYYISIIKNIKVNIGEKLIIGSDKKFADVILEDFDDKNVSLNWYDLIEWGIHTVSEKHLELTVINEKRVKIRDLGSKYGTLINGKEIFPQKDYYIKMDDIITVGDYEIEFEDDKDIKKFAREIRIEEKILLKIYFLKWKKYIKFFKRKLLLKIIKIYNYKLKEILKKKFLFWKYITYKKKLLFRIIRIYHIKMKNLLLSKFVYWKNLMYERKNLLKRLFKIYEEYLKKIIKRKFNLWRSLIKEDEGDDINEILNNYSSWFKEMIEEKLENSSLSEIKENEHENSIELFKEKIGSPWTEFILFKKKVEEISVSKLSNDLKTKQFFLALIPLIKSFVKWALLTKNLIISLDKINRLIITQFNNLNKNCINKSNEYKKELDYRLEVLKNKLEKEYNLLRNEVDYKYEDNNIRINKNKNCILKIKGKVNKNKYLDDKNWIDEDIWNKLSYGEKILKKFVFKIDQQNLLPYQFNKLSEEEKTKFLQKKKIWKRNTIKMMNELKNEELKKKLWKKFRFFENKVKFKGSILVLERVKQFKKRQIIRKNDESSSEDN